MKSGAVGLSFTLCLALHALLRFSRLVSHACVRFATYCISCCEWFLGFNITKPCFVCIYYILLVLKCRALHSIAADFHSLQPRPSPSWYPPILWNLPAYTPFNLTASSSLGRTRPPKTAPADPCSTMSWFYWSSSTKRKSTIQNASSLSWECPP